MHLSSTEKSTLVVKNVRNGKGIVTKKKFLPNETIFEVAGIFVACDEDDDMDEAERNNTFRFDVDRYISPKGRIADYLNHSCEPNAKVLKKNKKLFVVAINTIPKNVEVVIDYSTITARDDIWTMKCNCGTESCRGIIKKFSSLPKRIRENYITHSIVPKYILKI